MHHHDPAARSTVAAVVDPAERVVEELRLQGIDAEEACARARVDRGCLAGRAMLFEELVALAAVCGRAPAFFFDD